MDELEDVTWGGKTEGLWGGLMLTKHQRFLSEGKNIVLEHWGRCPQQWTTAGQEEKDVLGTKQALLSSRSSYH